LKHGFIYESSMMGHDHLPCCARVGNMISVEEAMRFGPEIS